MERMIDRCVRGSQHKAQTTRGRTGMRRKITDQFKFQSATVLFVDEHSSTAVSVCECKRFLGGVGTARHSARLEGWTLLYRQHKTVAPRRVGWRCVPHAAKLLTALKHFVAAVGAICWRSRHKKHQPAGQYACHLEHARHTRPHLAFDSRVHGCASVDAQHDHTRRNSSGSSAIVRLV